MPYICIARRKEDNLWHMGDHTHPGFSICGLKRDFDMLLELRQIGGFDENGQWRKDPPKEELCPKCFHLTP